MLFHAIVDVIRLAGPLSAQADDVGNRRFKLFVDDFQDLERFIYWLLVRSCFLRRPNVSELRGHITLAIINALVEWNFLIPPLDKVALNELAVIALVAGLFLHRSQWQFLYDGRLHCLYW